jgi:hypothetical protein
MTKNFFRCHIFLQLKLNPLNFKNISVTYHCVNCEMYISIESEFRVKKECKFKHTIFSNTTRNRISC